MTEQELDDLLPRALLQAQRERWEPVTREGPELAWTAGRQRVMDKVRADPFGYGKRWARPLGWRVAAQVGRAAAWVIVAGAITFTVVPPARAWAGEVIQAAVEWLDTHVRVTYSGEPQGGLETWRPTYLPEGFEEVSAVSLTDKWVIRYVDQDDKRIVFEYMLTRAGRISDFDREHSDFEEITINGQPAYFFRSDTEGKASSLIWYNEEGKIAFKIMAYIEPEEVLKIAEKVDIE